MAGEMTTAPVFELRSGETWRDPFPMYAALRDRDPVHHVARGDYYVLSRFDDVWAAAGDSATFSSARLQAIVVLEEPLARCPNFHVDVAQGRYAEGSYVRRHESLPWRA